MLHRARHCGQASSLVKAKDDIGALDCLARSALAQIVDGARSHQNARTLVERGTRQVILGHLSRTNNTPQLALDTVASVLDGLGVVLLCAPELGYMEIEVGECCLCSL